MNVSCDSNENIREATITITFPCKQTMMKHDMDKFNLTQFECRIRNLINLILVNGKKLCVFPASVILNITNQSCHHFSRWCDFFQDAYFFLWSSIFSIHPLSADILEESSPHW